MGHGLNNVLQDVVVRYHRMKGDETLWIPGTDHAGIATQNVVERQLKAEGKTRHDLGREAFLKRTWEVKEKHHSIITNQLRKIGASVDFIIILAEQSVKIWDGWLPGKGDIPVNTSK